MRVIGFDLCGKMAHFRKYYSNSTALSYYVPPVATVKGILAGLMGWERDSYYTQLSNANCRIAIGTGSKVRKITQTMNLLKVESLNDLNGSSRPTKQTYGANHTQNNTEWVIPLNLRTDCLRYVVRVAVPDNDELFDALAQRICSFGQGYGSNGISLALGSVQCLGWIENGRLYEAESQTEPMLQTKFAIPVDCVKGVDFSKGKAGAMSLLKEESITEFQLVTEKKASYRLITENAKENIMVSGNGAPITFQLHPSCSFWRDEAEEYMFLGRV